MSDARSREDRPNRTGGEPADRRDGDPERPGGRFDAGSRGGAVDARGLGKTYDSDGVPVHALRGADLRVEPGTFLVVLGPSGSGKTTLLNLIGGIDAPSEGTITVDGHRLEGSSDRELTEYRRDTVGFVFQFFNLIPTLTAAENVELIAQLTGAGGDARDLLAAVGLAERADAFPNALSGGERQRVGIARALAKRPRLLLCDEPTGSLDLDTGREVLTLLRNVNRERGLTTIAVTHNTAIARMADRVVRMRSGEIVEDDTVASPIAPSEVSW